MDYFQPFVELCNIIPHLVEKPCPLDEFEDCGEELREKIICACGCEAYCQARKTGTWLCWGQLAESGVTRDIYEAIWRKKTCENE